MKRYMTLLGALAAVICFTRVSAAQDLVRVYSPQSYAYVGTTTNYGYGVSPVYQTSNYAPVTTYYAPSVVPTTTYYAPAVVPTTTYYAPAVVPTTAYYSPTAAVVPYSTYYVPAAVPYYGRAYYYAPAPFVPFQPIRNTFCALTW